MTGFSDASFGDGDRKFVTALARGLEILSAFRPGDDMLSNAEISRRTRLPKATVTRLIYTLHRLGFLASCAETGRFYLHPHVLSLGYPVLIKLDVRQVARPLMQELADHCGGTVTLGVRDALHMIFVERARDRSVLTLPMDVGSRIAIPTSSMGRAYLAAVSEEERAALLARIAEARPDDWPQLRAGIDRALADYKRRGYCVSAGEWEPDVNAVGVPIHLRDDQVLAFNCGGPSSRIRRDMLEDLGERLKRLAKSVEMAARVSSSPSASTARL